MARLLAALLGVAAAAAAAAAPKTTNLTVYRVTPHNYSGLANMNSGDAAGDAYFALYELTFPLYVCERGGVCLVCVACVVRCNVLYVAV